MDFIDRCGIAAQGFCDNENTLIVDACKILFHARIVPFIYFGQMQPVYANLQRTCSLEDSSFKIPVNGHDFARGFHLCAECMVGKNEFVERPAWEFHNAIIKCRLEAGLGFLRDRVRDFIERIPNGNLGGNLGNRVACCLGSQCRRTADTGIDFDDDVFIAVRVQGILGITAAFYAKLADNAQRSAAQHLIFMVGKCLGRCYDNAVTRMHADRVEVLHVADGDAVIVAITHDLILDFLPACDAAFNENLSNHTVFEPFDDRFDEFFLIFSNAAARAAHGISRAHNQRITDLVSKIYGGRHILNNRAFRDWLAKFLHGFLEELTIFGLLDGLQ